MARGARHSVSAVLKPPCAPGYRRQGEVAEVATLPVPPRVLVRPGRRLDHDDPARSVDVDELTAHPVGHHTLAVRIQRPPVVAEARVRRDGARQPSRPQEGLLAPAARVDPRRDVGAVDPPVDLRRADARPVARRQADVRRRECDSAGIGGSVQTYDGRMLGPDPLPESVQRRGERLSGRSLAHPVQNHGVRAAVRYSASPAPPRPPSPDRWSLSPRCRPASGARSVTRRCRDRGSPRATPTPLVIVRTCRTVTRSYPRPGELGDVLDDGGVEVSRASRRPRRPRSAARARTSWRSCREAGRSAPPRRRTARRRRHRRPRRPSLSWR